MTDQTAEPQLSPLVVFGPDDVDTSQAEMLVQCLNDKIKEKRFKLHKMTRLNEEKNKRNELMKTEKLQLAAKLVNIEQENSIREQQLESEQNRIKELQLNIQMLDDHNNSIKRDFTNEEKKYEQEKSALIAKFERTKQQWTDVFKPQYEQSKVYQYLKQGDLAYTALAERKQGILDAQMADRKAYLTRRHQFCNERHLHSVIVHLAEYYIRRRDQSVKIEQMQRKLIELENKRKHLMETKADKMQAWETVYTQPVERDLMDFCLQTNIEQALTLSFTQMQQDTWSQPMTPVPAMISTPKKDSIESVDGVQSKTSSSASSSFQPPTPNINNDAINQIMKPSSPQLTASTITFAPTKAKDVPKSIDNVKNVSVEQDHSPNGSSSVLHLTTAIDDDDEALFSISHRQKMGTQMEQLPVNNLPPSTQGFLVTTPSINSDADVDREVSSSFQNSNDQPLTQVFAVPVPLVSSPVHDLITPISNMKLHPSSSVDTTLNTSHPNLTFQLPLTLAQSRPVTPAAGSIQPQVTSNDVQQMLLTFSPGPPPSANDEQPQPMEDDSQQQPSQQRPTFQMPSSASSIDDGYTGFNYNFGFDATPTAESGASSGGLTSPINFDNWASLGSPVTTNTNDQFSAFLQPMNTGDSGVDTSFSFASFNYGDLGGGEPSAAANGAFGSFFFGSGGDPAIDKQAQGGK